ncbi:MAG: hypothetical protein QNK37_09510 [Acidobacteriota bacterium]|nr:hypothetical protein [Acidobacteriota bacterium]
MKKVLLTLTMAGMLAAGASQLFAVSVVNCFIDCGTWLEICENNCSDYACFKQCQIGYEECKKICG